MDFALLASIVLFISILHFICHLATPRCAVERECSTHGTRMWLDLCVYVYVQVVYVACVCVCVCSPIQIEIECFVLKT